MRQETIAERYAKAFLDIGIERNSLEAFGAELDKVNALFEESEELRLLVVEIAAGLALQHLDGVDGLLRDHAIRLGLLAGLGVGHQAGAAPRRGTPGLQELFATLAVPQVVQADPRGDLVQP